MFNKSLKLIIYDDHFRNHILFSSANYNLTFKI